MRLLRVFGIGSATLLLSFSFAYADAADDLLRALGGTFSVDTASATSTTVQSTAETPSPAPETTEPVLSDAEKEKQIANLQALVKVLLQQLQEILAKKAADASAAATAAKAEALKPENCAPITRTLKRGLNGDDVRCMQLVLVADGLLAAENATGVFGPLTDKALKQFQLEHDLVTIGSTVASGIVGENTRAALNTYLPLLAQLSGSASTTPDRLFSPSISFGPQLPNGVEPAYFSIKAGEKNDYVLRVAAQNGGAYNYTIDWADGSRDEGNAKSNVLKTTSHIFNAGVYEVHVEAHNGFGSSEEKFVIDVDPAGSGGDLLEIATPQAAFTFDVVTQMPVTIHVKDPRVTGTVRLYLQDSSSAHLATGYFLGELPVTPGDSTAKFSLYDIQPATYWLEAIGTKFQECLAGICKDYLPTHTIGPIQITDASGYLQSSSTPGDIEPGSTTTPITSP